MAFPTTSVLDSGVGANANPLNTNWAGLFAGNAELVRQANTIGAAVNTASCNVWDISRPGPDCEAYVTIATKPPHAGIVSVYARVQNANGPSCDGYRVSHVNNTVGTDALEIRRVDNAASTLLASFAQDLTDGDSIGISIVGDLISAWANVSGAGWVVIGTFTDKTYPYEGRLGLEVTESVATTTKLTNFGGGTITSAARVFPTLTLLDDFNRANNASLGANWLEAANGKSNRGEIVSNTVSVVGSGASSINAYIGAGAPNSLKVACSLKWAAIAAAINDAGGLAVTKVSDTTKGYHFELDVVTGADVRITFWNDFTALQVDSATARIVTGFGLPAVNDSVGMIFTDNGTSCTMEVWLHDGTSWTLAGWQVFAGSDYNAGPYYSSIRVKYDTEDYDDFKGADIVTAAEKQTYYGYRRRSYR